MFFKPTNLGTLHLRRYVAAALEQRLLMKIYAANLCRFSKNGIAHVISNEKLKSLGVAFPAQQKIH